MTLGITPAHPVRVHRSLLGAAVASVVFIALGLTGCSTSTSSDTSTSPVTLTFWSWVPGIEKNVALWNKENPDIQIKLNRIPSSDSSKIPADVDAGTGPDIAQLSQHALPAYIIKKEVQDITPYVKSTKNLYSPASWKSVNYSGKVYAVPQDSGPTALMYRADLFEKYGLSVPSTWDEYIADAQKLQAADPSVYLASFTPNEPSFFYNDMVQGGGSVYGTSGNSWTVPLNNSATQAVAARWQSLLDQKLLKVEQMWTPQYWSDVNNGKIASINYSGWFPVILEQNAPDLAGDWRVAPSPSTSGKGPFGEGGGSVISVMKGAKHPEQAAKFITWLNSAPASLATLITDGGLFPSAKAGLTTDALNKPDPYFGGQVINKVFAADAANESTSNVEGPNYNTVWADLTDALNSVGNGTITFSQALDQVTEKAKADLKSQGLSVK